MHVGIQYPDVPLSFCCLPGKQSKLCSFDLSSSDVWKVALVTVHKHIPGTVDQVPPGTIHFGLFLLLVTAASVG